MKCCQRKDLNLPKWPGEPGPRGSLGLVCRNYICSSGFILKSHLDSKAAGETQDPPTQQQVGDGKAPRLWPEPQTVNGGDCVQTLSWSRNEMLNEGLVICLHHHPGLVWKGFWFHTFVFSAMFKKPGASGTSAANPNTALVMQSHISDWDLKKNTVGQAICPTLTSPFSETSSKVSSVSLYFSKATRWSTASYK